MTTLPEPQEPTVDVEPPEPTPGESTPVAEQSEQSLVASFNRMVAVPPFLQRWYEQFGQDRKYVNEEVLLLDTPDVVSTNYILRNQYILLANLYAREPAISWKQGAFIGEPPPLLGKYGKTLEVFCKKMSEEMEMRRILRAGVQEASTVGWQVFKLCTQEDYKLDPIGSRRQDDRLDNIARLQWLRQRFQAGQFTEDDALFKEMKDCELVVADYLRAQLEAELVENPPAMTIDPMTGQPAVSIDPVTGEQTTPPPSDPRLDRLVALSSGQIPTDLEIEEVARFIGFNLDMIQAEDFRFDWTVSNIENLHQGQWISHRVFMDYDTFGSKFDVSPDEIGAITIYGADGRQVGDRRWTRSGPMNQSWFDSESPSDRSSTEAQTNMGRCAVWELWHKGLGRVYVWVEGMNRFLLNYVPTATGRRWYPFYIYGPNRVAGRAIPISDTVLTSSLQDELNMLRTHEREARRAAFPRIFIRRGALSDEEKLIVEESNPYQVIELTSPEDVNKAFAESKPLPFNRELYDRGETRMEMEMMSGISRNAAGTGDADLATSAAIANEQMGIQTDFRRALLEELIFDILYDVALMGVRIFPEENIKRICGTDAYWPMLERETFLRYLKLDVRAGSTGRPDSKRRLAEYEQFAGIIAQLGLPVDAEALAEELFYEMDLNDWKRFLLTPEKMAMRVAQGLPPVPGMMAPGMAPPGAPRGNAAQPNPTPGSGAPPMAERGAPTPEQVPGPV